MKCLALVIQYNEYSQKSADYEDPHPQYCAGIILGLSCITQPHYVSTVPEILE